MAKATDDQEAPALSLRERGAAVVRELSAVGAELFPLRQKRDAGGKLTKRQLQRLEQLETRYRTLEGDLRLLMRPRSRDPWLYGRDHLHGPDDVDHS